MVWVDVGCSQRKKLEIEGHAWEDEISCLWPLEEGSVSVWWFHSLGEAARNSNFLEHLENLGIYMKIFQFLRIKNKSKGFKLLSCQTECVCWPYGAQEPRFAVLR